MTKAVAKKANTAVAGGFDYGDDAGRGFENTTSSELAIPFITILQALSPQCIEDSPKGSKPGMFYNTVTNELTDGTKGFVIQPVYKDAAYVEWIKRIEGGGFVAVHDPSGDVVKAALEANGGDKFSKLEVDGHDLIETYYVYSNLLNDEGTEKDGIAVLAFKITGIKPYRGFNTSMYLVKGRPPIYAHRARVTTFLDENKNGKFYNFKIEPLRDTWVTSLVNPGAEKELMRDGRDFADQVMNGIAKADFSQEKAAGDNAADEGSADNPPF